MTRTEPFKLHESQQEAAAEAAAYRAEAAEHERRKQESWERSDTDGFLSQWASGLSAQLARAKADLVEAGGTAEFCAVFDGDDLVPTKRVETKYGIRRVTLDANGRFDRWFSFATGPRSNFAKAGFTERQVTHSAAAVMDGRGRGLSGTAWVAVKPTCEKCDSFIDAIGRECRCGHLTKWELT